MAFKERISNNLKPIAWRGNIPVEFVYTTGQGGEKFFKALRDSEKILGSFCERCKVTYVPARIFCERCMAELKEFKDVGKKGKVLSYTIIKKDGRGNLLPEPRILGLIAFEGTTGGLLHYIHEDKKGDLHIGAEVEAVFEKKSERKGSILDIKYFRVVG